MWIRPVRFENSGVGESEEYVCLSIKEPKSTAAFHP